MTAPADRIFTNAAVHPFADDRTAEAVAVRDGAVVRVDSAYEVDFLNGVETEVIDLDGRVLLPGFIDAHTHLDIVGRRQVDADLSGADSPADCVDLLADAADVHDEWLLGFGYDESTWSERRYLTRDDLDRVSEDRPVAAFREDLHVVSVNSVALDRYLESMPAADVRREGGNPTGVLVEGALDVIDDAIEPDREQLRSYLLAAQRVAHERGVTGVHDMIRSPDAPRIYRDLDREDRLTLRVRLNYWSDFLDAVLETGLRSNHGTDRVRPGAIKTFTDGSIGGRTARLSRPYADDPDERGTWVVDPAAFRALANRVADADLQLAAHAIGDEAIDLAVDTLDGIEGMRHRIEHAEVLTDELVATLGNSDVVVSAQPNFHRWAREDGLYAARLGDQRRIESNRFGALADAGATLAFGSDCMPFDPLFGIEQAVNAPTAAQRLDVTDALQAYTQGSAYAGFDEDRLGTIEPGKRADFVVLDRSPWAVEPDAIGDLHVAMTVVDGAVVFEDNG
jgi:hypothetical protein